MDIDQQLLFVMFDIESNGPCPGLYSMLGFGICGVDINEKIVFKMERNLKTLPEAGECKDTMEFWAKNPESYKYVTTNPEEPTQPMIDFYNAIEELKKEWTVIPVAKPGSYDWQWINYYFVRFNTRIEDEHKRNPFGFACECMSSFSWFLSGKLCPWGTRNAMIDKYKGNLVNEFPHQALGDAIYQGKVFVRMLNAWQKDVQESMKNLINSPSKRVKIDE